jgi:hypothetical protein
MTVTVTAQGVVLLEGVCPIEDADILLRRLSEDPDATVDWSDCKQAHTAVIQVMLAAAPKIIGAPADIFLREHVGTMMAVLKSGA